MTTYLLDTNACIALINGTEINVRRRFKRAVARESVILLSSIVAFELWYGVAKSQRKDSNTQRLETFLGGPLEWALFDEDDARAAGTVRAELETVGRPVGAYDVLLAGQARRRRATLVTSNTKEFARVHGLKWEDWAASRR
jgi:tRNA(fMet)-specific endonuclease VapC